RDRTGDDGFDVDAGFEIREAGRQRRGGHRLLAEIDRAAGTRGPRLGFVGDFPGGRGRGFSRGGVARGPVGMGGGRFGFGVLRFAFGAGRELRFLHRVGTPDDRGEFGRDLVHAGRQDFGGVAGEEHRWRNRQFLFDFFQGDRVAGFDRAAGRRFAGQGDRDVA